MLCTVLTLTIADPAFMNPIVHTFPHTPSGTLTHVVHDPATRRAAIIDAALDFDPASGRISVAPVRALLAHVREHGLRVDWLLETHAHADHLSATGWLQQRIEGARSGVGAGIVAVQRSLRDLLDLGDALPCDGSPFDRLFEDDERFALGELDVHVLATPGHTSDSLSYRIGDAVFVGDTLFAPDAGTARCDFPGGDAATLYRSIQRLYGLPATTRVFLCHDYPAAGASARSETTIAAERAHNIHLRDGVSESAYVELRIQRDASLAIPRLLWPAMQFNLRGGRLPPAEASGRSYFRTPLSYDVDDAS